MLDILKIDKNCTDLVIYISVYGGLELSLGG